MDVSVLRRAASKGLDNKNFTLLAWLLGKRRPRRGIGSGRLQSSTRATFGGWVESRFAAIGHDQVTLRLALMQGPGRPERWAPMRPVGACLLGPDKGPKDALRRRHRLSCGSRCPSPKPEGVFCSRK